MGGAQRSRKFTPTSFFLTTLKLVGGTNEQGYLQALTSSWATSGDMAAAPTKSSLSEYRDKVSYEFFEDLFKDKIADFKNQRLTWRGMHVYACDGDQYEIPLSDDILEHGFRGYPCKDHTETHFPRMYIVHAYDVLSRVTKDFRHSHQNKEVRLAFDMAANFEENSVTLYDRLFFSKEMISTHSAGGHFFVAKCKEGGTFKEVIEFWESAKRNDSFYFDGQKIHLVKVVNPRTHEASVYATNLERSCFRNVELDELYALRWQAETAFRDLSCTMKIEQWHSKKLNGVLQELYASLWLYNHVRILMALHNPKKRHKEVPMKYCLANFKLIFHYFIDEIRQFVCKKWRKIKKCLLELVRRGAEKREHRKRTNPRCLRKSPKNYPRESIVERRG